MPAFTVDSAALSAALAPVARIVERRNTIPILSNVVLAVAPGGAVTLRASNLDQEGAATIYATDTTPGAFTVAAHMLADIVKGAKGGRVTIATNGKGRATIDDGRAVRTLPTLPVDDFPALAETDTDFAFAIDGDTLARDLARLLPFMGREETRYYLIGAHVEERAGVLRMSATDGYCSATIERAAPVGADGVPGVIIPRGALEHLAHALKARPGVSVGVRLSATRAVLALPGFTLTTKLVDGTFPDVGRNYPGDDLAHALTIDAGTLAARIIAAGKRPVGGGMSALLTIEPAATGTRAGWGETAAALSAEYQGEGDCIAPPRSLGAALKGMTGRVVLAWDDADGVATLHDPAAPEFSGMCKLVPGAALPAPVAPVASTYQAPDGAAVDLFNMAGIGGGAESYAARCAAIGGARKASDVEVAAYLVDYARRAGLSTSGTRAPIYVDGVAFGMMFGAQASPARHVEREHVCYETFTTRKESVWVPAQFTDGAYCVVMPGRIPAPVLADTGEGWGTVALDGKGALALDRATIVEAVGEVEKPAKAKCGRKAAEKPAQAVSAPPAPAEAPAPVSAPVEALSAPEAVAIIESGAWDGADPVDAPPVEAAPVDDMAATLAALVARVAALEAAAAPVVEAAPPPAPVVRDRSAARLRMIRAYLALRAERNRLRDQLDQSARVLARAEAEGERIERAGAAALAAERARSVRLATAARSARRGRADMLRRLGAAAARADRAEDKAVAAINRADVAERLARLGSAAPVEAPGLVIVTPAYSRRAADTAAAL